MLFDAQSKSPTKPPLKARTGSRLFFIGTNVIYRYDYMDVSNRYFVGLGAACMHRGGPQNSTAKVDNGWL